MSINGNQATQDLLKNFNGVLSNWNDVSSLACGLPTAQLADTLQKAADLIDLLMNLPASVWEALYDVIRCDYDGLADLTIEELKKLLDALKKLAALNLSTMIEGHTEFDQETHDQLEIWVQELCEIIDNMDPKITKEALADLIEGALEWAKDNFPKVIDEYKEQIGKEVLEMIKGWSTSAGGLKFIVSQIVSQAMKRLGGEAAKKLAPGVGTLITLAELGVLTGAVIAAATLKAMADNLLAALVDQMVSLGSGWPNCFSAIGLCGPGYMGGTATLQLYTQCGDGSVTGTTFGDPQQQPFSDGSTSQSANLNSGNFNSDTDCHEIPYSPDLGAISGAAGNNSHCIFYVEITATDGNGNTTQTHLLAGVYSAP